MLIPVPYFELIREMCNACNHRFRLVQYVRQAGMKIAVRAFQTTVPTVRKAAAALPAAMPLRLVGTIPSALSPAPQDPKDSFRLRPYLQEKVKASQPEQQVGGPGSGEGGQFVQVP